MVATLDAVSGGSGHLFLLEGEPGIGKTQLARTLGDEARARGFAVVWGRCWEEGGAPAYWPWTQVLRALVRQRGRDRLLEGDVATLQHLVPIVSELAAVVPDDSANGEAPTGQFALFDAAATLLMETVAERPTVVMLDDLHAADHDSLRLLQFLARDLPQSRLLIVGTFRADDAAQSGAAALLAKLARDGPVPPLRGLPEAQG